MGLDVMHIGDSITAGQRVAEAVRWTTLVGRRLKETFGAGVIESRVSGVSGETTRIGLERFPRDVQDRRPAIITLQYGMNDCNCWETDLGVPRVSEDAFAANLREMIRRARHFGTGSVILATNPRSLRTRRAMESGEVYEDANARYSELVREVATVTETTLCDIRAAFEDLDERDLAPLLKDDLLHLDAAGHSLYADVIWPFVAGAVEDALGAAATRAVA